MIKESDELLLVTKWQSLAGSTDMDTTWKISKLRGSIAVQGNMETSQHAGLQSQPTLTSNVTLGKLLNISVPRLLHL